MVASLQMAVSLHSILFGPRPDAPTVSPAQRRADVVQPFLVREAASPVTATRRTAPAVQVRLSKEALAYLGGDTSVLAQKNARAQESESQTPAPASPPQARADYGALALDELKPETGPVIAPYVAQADKPERLLPPGSTLDIRL